MSTGRHYNLRCDRNRQGMFMAASFSLFLVVVYLVAATAGIALLGAWVLKRFGRPRK